MNALIVGANRGLGLELCHAYAAKGFTVYAGVASAQPHEELAELTRESDVVMLDMDVTSPEEITAAAKYIADNCGKLDVLVYCSGILCDSDRTLPINRTDIDDLRMTLEINTVGAACVIGAFYTLINDGGWFLVITSEAGSMQNIGTVYPAYSVAKAAENKLVAIFAKTISDYRIYAVHPGRMNTQMGREFAQIEPAESAGAICSITLGEKKLAGNGEWFINYMGNPMEV